MAAIITASAAGRGFGIAPIAKPADFGQSVALTIFNLNTLLGFQAA
ncbi:hypothetical protein [Paralysiella testudinis]|uniref:Uncharacterized protein n=1 Tax=Paralysiella testudinis TaxID=2809020 RepID=A0A892ZEW0_9NEIS|nr:hypothetical protein [Paralysiella testudinis]QRQ81183.1 hypothetical protein JQU52_10695 [Paralysiella testudinis]